MSEHLDPFDKWLDDVLAVGAEKQARDAAAAERLRDEAAQYHAQLVQARIEAGALDAALTEARALLREAAAALGADWRIADDHALAARIREVVGDE